MIVGGGREPHPCYTLGMDECIFCKIVKGKSPAAVEYETDSVIVIKNINPVSEIHLLVIPKKHVSNFLELDNETVTDLTKVAQKVIRDKNLGDGYKLVINGGKYQAVPHFHWHLLSGRLEKNDILNKT